MALFESQLRVGNFKKVKDEREGHKNSAAREDREGMDAKHLADIRKLPCCVRGCPAMPGGDPHHLRHGPAKDERGAGLSATDRRTVPLCRDHHTAGVDCVHKVGSKKEAAWFKAHGVPHPLALAASLWAATSLEQKMKIVITNKTSGAA